MEELWNISIFLKIAIIQNIRNICEKIYQTQIQRGRVENIISRYFENSEETLTINNKFNKNEIKYAFIEYMSYRLKQYGKRAIGYQNILEEEVNKLGLSISDVISLEHFYVATQKVTMGNCIKSLKEINRIDFQEIFDEINGTEEILKKDPAKVYEIMTQETKNNYRNVIEEFSRKANVSEVYIAEKLIELSERYKNSNNLLEKKKSHIGYYLIDNGVEELKEKLGIKSKGLNILQKSRLYISSFFTVTILLDFIIGYIFLYSTKSNIIYLISLVLLYIPISEIYLKILNYILSKIVKPKKIPKIDFENGITKENSSMVVIPSILTSKEKVIELMKKLEVYYLANKSENLYFTLLGDVTESDKKDISLDKEIVKTGEKFINELNRKYVSEIPIFNFLYRKRVWSPGEEKFIGWERKRGLLQSFTEFIGGERKNDFLYNSLENKSFPKIKYIITLDSDTELVLDSAYLLIGAMEHILNKPVIENERVIDGYGIMQPRIGIDLDVSKKSLFVQIFSMQGGFDFYTNAISDIYQDNFGEGIFTGKGIYNVDVYNKILKNKIPENKILSHDLIEGNYLRCALLTDVLLLDGYPAKYNAYMARKHRWIRGDFQIASFLKEKNLNEISKFKIFDNMRRSFVSIISVLSIVIGAILYKYYKMLGITLISFSVISSIISSLIDIINYIVFKESNIQGAVYAYKKFSCEITGNKASILRMILEIAFLPYDAYVSLDAIIRSIYRQIKEKKLLEWTTAEAQEKNSKTDLKSYYILMISNIISGAVLLLFKNIFTQIMGILWIIAPIFAWKISKNLKNNQELLKEDEKEYLINIGKKTWKYFDEFINKENNFLIPDNYQDDRKPKYVKRTSSTNIGLELLAIISANDLEFIDTKKAIEMIKNVLDTVKSLSKWNGHLYNWYNIATLSPLIPRYISTVDSGNFVGYLFIVKDFLIENRERFEVEEYINYINDLISNTDFSVLYSQKNRLFSIGYNLEDNELTDSYYDFLASEARQASLVAIAKRDVSFKHWNNLSRTLTALKNYKGLISWSGTAFEYLMPNINIKRYYGSLLDEASKFLIMSQIEYSKKLNIPWGISEAAFNLRDLNYNYQYKAFGIPWLGLKRGLSEEVVISPYSTFLAISDVPKQAIENLKRIEEYGGIGQFGFYESIDFTPSRLKPKEKYAVVKTFMAHHQGLTLLSINNAINKNILQKRFHNNPEIEAVSILLEERMPSKIILTKEKKEKPEKIKLKNITNYKERIFDKEQKDEKSINVIANSNYMICIDTEGKGYSKYKNKLINYFKSTDEVHEGIKFYIKNVKSKKVINSIDKIVFAPDKAEFYREYGSIEIKTKITVAQESNTEIRRIEIKNNSNQEEIFEVTAGFEPIISEAMQHYMHPSFNKLFLRYENNDDNLIIKRVNKQLEDEIFLGTTFYTENETIGNLDFEIDKEKFMGRENIETPISVVESKKFSNSINTTIDPFVAFRRTVKINKKDKCVLDLIITVSENREEVIEELNYFKNKEEVSRAFEISRARVEEEMKYLQIDGDKIEIYQSLLKYIIFENPSKKYQLEGNNFNNFSNNFLWQFGISGDIPIILVKINSIEDIDTLKSIIEAYEYYRVKNIDTDLVIIDEEKSVYEQIVKEKIETCISERQLEYLKNIKTGIFVIKKNEMSKENIEALKIKSSVIIDCKNGDLKSIVKEMDENEKKEKFNISKNNILENEAEEGLNIPKNQELKYDNEFGGFDTNSNEYVIYVDKNKKLPSVWSHIIASKNFGSIITQNLGGYTWCENSRLNRLTSWGNNSLIDIPSEIIYFYDAETQKIWSLNSNVCSSGNNYEIKYGFGYVNIRNKTDEIISDTNIFIPLNEKLKITKINLKNISNIKKDIYLLYYIKPVLGEDEIITSKYIKIYKEKNIIYMKNLCNEDFKKIAYISCSEKIENIISNKSKFFINGIKNPKIITDKINPEDTIGINPCACIQIKVELKPFENKEISLMLGEEDTELEIKNKVYKYGNLNNVIEEEMKVKKYWYDLTSRVRVKTPIESFNIMLNGWCVYQTIVSRLLGKTAYYQSGGAIGFRDQLQDCLGLKFIDANFLREQILIAARHQFVEGDVEHWWHEETKRGIRTKFSDDLLWLAYCTCEYVEFTGDKSILDENVPYLVGEILDETTDERYDKYDKSDISESIYMHCKRAIEKSFNFGKNGFPKIGSGDWNDGFNTVGNKGIGESIWLGFFLYEILCRFINLSKERNDTEFVQRCEKIILELKRNLNNFGWDGRWYRRAIMDNGEILGTIENDECKIDSLCQSFAVISGAGDNDKKYMSMESVETHLIDKENNLIKLMDPGFEKGHLKPGYIKQYPAGIRENGGQYTHECCCYVQF